MPSLVVAWTPTGAPTIADSAASIAARWGASRGRSHTTTAWALTADIPAPATRSITTDSSRAPDAPSQAGSPEGKTAPMSGSPGGGEQGVAERVGDDVAVGVAHQALVVGDVDRPQHQRPPRPEAVRVGAGADPHPHLIGTWVGSRPAKRVMVS